MCVYPHPAEFVSLLLSVHYILCFLIYLIPLLFSFFVTLSLYIIILFLSSPLFIFICFAIPAVLCLIFAPSSMIYTLRSSFARLFPFSSVFYVYNVVLFITVHFVCFSPADPDSVLFCSCPLFILYTPRSPFTSFFYFLCVFKCIVRLFFRYCSFRVSSEHPGSYLFSFASSS